MQINARLQIVWQSYLHMIQLALVRSRTMTENLEQGKLGFYDYISPFAS